MIPAKPMRLLIAGSLALASSGAAFAQEEPLPALPLRMSAFAVNLSGAGRARPTTLEIVIERWSTEEEKDKLLTTLIERGEDKLLDMVQDIKPRAGFIRTTQSLGWDISFAKAFPRASGGFRLVFVTDRPMGFYELRNSTRSRDYEFMVCEIRIGKDGKGEGKLAAGTKITYDKDKKQVEIENYGQEPVRLTTVSVDKK
jgi:hypothetical protein